MTSTPQRPVEARARFEQPVTFTRRRRQAIAGCLHEVAVGATALVAGAVIVGSGPVDYRFYAWLASCYAVLVLVLLMPVVVVRLMLRPRMSVTVTADGVVFSGGTGLVRWADIAALDTAWLPSGSHPRLTLRNGRRLRLAAPRGSPWLPDSAFWRARRVLRQRALAHGVRVERAVRHWPAGPVAAAMLLVWAVLTVAVFRAVDRTVIWPWAPIAAVAPGACPALDAAGLGRHWPAVSRTRERDETVQDDMGTYSYCSWVSTSGQDAPFMRVALAVKRHSPYWVYSATANAARDYGSAQSAAQLPRPLPGLGDAAFTADVGQRVSVVARRANVTVSVDVDLDGPSQPSAAGSFARGLASAVLADVRLG